jgi:spermidine synthase
VSAAVGRKLPVGQRAVAPNVTISESAGVRYLHFGSVWVQGAMRIARPFALELEYQQQMMAPALLLPRPAHIVQLGLGAGALARFCWRAYPRATIRVVEISEQVIAAAGRWFRLPRDDRLMVLRGDAREALADPRRRAFGGNRADWLQVDLYDAGARGPVCDDEDFYADCRRLLAPAGVAAINLFGRGFESSRRRIDAAFGGRTCVLPESDAGNRVVLAFSRTAPDIPHSSLLARAVALERRLRLPARRWIGALKSAGNRRR